MHKIYALIHPKTKRKRYIGKTLNTLGHRLSEHITYAKRKPNQNKRTKWIFSLLNKGLRPEIVLLEYCTKENWRNRELYWCSQYKFLVNSKKAGGGNDGKRWKTKDDSEFVHLLGKISDARIAEKFDVTRKTITYYRKKLGIKPYSVQTGCNGKFSKGMPHPRWSKYENTKDCPAS